MAVKKRGEFGSGRFGGRKGGSGFGKKGGEFRKGGERFGKGEGVDLAVVDLKNGERLIRFNSSGSGSYGSRGLGGASRVFTGDRSNGHGGFGGGNVGFGSSGGGYRI